MDPQESKTPFVSARLVILIVAAGGLALAFAFRTSAPPSEIVLDPGDIQEEVKEILQYALPGEEPEEPAEFDIQFEVDTSTVKTRLVMYITELHGYYVETLDVRFWWKGDDPDLERDDSTYSFVYHINNYIKANETFKDCIEVSVPEIERVRGDVGTAESWGVRIERYHRARHENPEVFPPVSTTGRYCS